jgi:hypothetical protein
MLHYYYYYYYSGVHFKIIPGPLLLLLLEDKRLFREKSRLFVSPAGSMFNL